MNEPLVLPTGQSPEAEIIDPARAIHALFARGVDKSNEEEAYKLFDELAELHAPVIADTLGVMAVTHALAQTGSIIYEGESSKHIEELLTKELTAARDRLDAIDIEDRSFIERQLGLGNMPGFLLETVAPNPESTIIDRLVQKNDEGQYAVPDDVFLNILEWHNHSMIDRRNKFEVEQWPALKDRYILQLKLGVYAGWLPESVLASDKLERLQTAKIIVDDGLMMYEGEMLGAMLKHDARSVAEVFLPEQPRSATVAHELSHSMEGFRIDRKLKRRGMRHRSSFGIYRLFGITGEKAGVMLNEAVTEHIAQTMVQGSPDMINPDVKLGSYTPERRVLDALCNNGLKKIDIRLFIEAYFEDTTRRRKGSAMAKLRHELRQAFPGEPIVSTLGQICERDKKRNTREDIVTYMDAVSAKMAKIKRVAEKPGLLNKLMASNLKHSRQHRVKIYKGSQHVDKNDD